MKKYSILLLLALLTIVSTASAIEMNIAWTDKPAATPADACAPVIESFTINKLNNGANLVDPASGALNNGIPKIPLKFSEKAVVTIKIKQKANCPIFNWEINLAKPGQFDTWVEAAKPPVRIYKEKAPQKIGTDQLTQNDLTLSFTFEKANLTNLTAGGNDWGFAAKEITSWQFSLFLEGAVNLLRGTPTGTATPDDPQLDLVITQLRTGTVPFDPTKDKSTIYKINQNISTVVPAGSKCEAKSIAKPEISEIWQDNKQIYKIGDTTPTNIDPSKDLKVYANYPSDTLSLTLDVWGLKDNETLPSQAEKDTSLAITSVSNATNRIRQFLFKNTVRDSSTVTNLFSISRECPIIIRTPISSAEYWKANEGTTTLASFWGGKTLNAFLTKTKEWSFSNYVLNIESTTKDAPALTDWVDSNPIKIQLGTCPAGTVPNTSGSSPACVPAPAPSGCQTVLQCLVEWNQKIVDQLLLKKKVQ